MATASTRLPEKFHPPKTFRLVIGKLASLNCLTDLKGNLVKLKEIFRLSGARIIPGYIIM